MNCRSTRWACAWLISMPFAAGQEETAGPPGGRPSPLIPGARETSGGGGGRSDPEGDDIRVNQRLNRWQNEPSISIDPNDPDHWVCAFNDYSRGDPTVGWVTTFDAGETWTTGFAELPSGVLFAGDPCVGFHPDSTVSLVYVGDGGGDRHLLHARSLDGGVVWEPPRSIDVHRDNNLARFAIDLSDGPLRGAMTLVWDRLDRSGSGLDFVLATSSFDQGATWSPKVRLDDPAESVAPRMPDICYAADSRLFAVWSDIAAQRIVGDTSFDGGLSWSGNREVTTYQSVPNPLPGDDFRILDLFSCDADRTDGPYSGAIYVTFHQWDDDGGADVVCATSHDDGQTWSSTLVHETGLGSVDQFFPAVGVDPHGNAQVVYYGRRPDRDNDLIWTWISRSADGGVTWSERLISDVGWDHKTSGFAEFIGDYIDVAAGSRNAVAIWCDSRPGGGSQDLYADALALDLFTNKDELSASAGGRVKFTVQVGPNHAGATYALLGTYSGTEPGLQFGNGVHLPLNWDLLTTLTWTLANTAVFDDFRGVLDASGGARATLDSLGPFDPAAVGLDLDFAVLVIDQEVTFGSNATRVRLVQ